MKPSLIAVCLMAIGLYLWNKDSKPSSPLAQQIKNPPAQKNSPAGQLRIPENVEVSEAARTPAQTKEETFEFNPQIEATLPLNGTNQVMLEISVIEKQKYRPEFGTKITEDHLFTFFRSPVVREDTWPVAYDHSRHKLYPVSHILHLKGVDEEQRQLLKAEGMTEYYYHKRLKYLSVKSTPIQVLKDFQQLKERGFDVRLEIIKERVKPN
jgi:hypothetical protein